MSITKSNLGPFLLQVGIPFVVAIAAIFAVYAGYSNLKNQIQTKNELDERAIEVENAFSRIDEQENALQGQKAELVEQHTITANLNAELEKQKEFNQLLNQIQIFSLGARNDSKEDFNKFYALVEADELNSDLNDIWQKEYSRLRKSWESELEKVNSFQLFANLATREKRNWSLEYLYSGISILGTNRGWQFNNKDVLAYFNEIGMSNSKYFIEVLYKIATEGGNISYSILAAKTLCQITEYEPYPNQQFSNSYKQLLNDIPKFQNLTKWWDMTGSKNKLYSCPFEFIVEYDRTYHSYDRDEKNPERLEELNNIVKDYPLLHRTQAEIAYLKLEGSETYSEVERLASLAIAGTDMEPLPYLLIAYISLKQKNLPKMNKYLDMASKSNDNKSMISCIQFNEKLHEFWGLPEIIKFMK